jgi:hypothetical protein
MQPGEGVCHQGSAIDISEPRLGIALAIGIQGERSPAFPRIRAERCHEVLAPGAVASLRMTIEPKVSPSAWWLV